MKTQSKQRKTFVVTFLTLLSATSSFAAAANGNRRPAAQAPAAHSAAAPQAQQQQQQQLAPPTNEATIRPSTSDGDEAGTLPERIDVQSMKRRYWTVGNEDLMDVVQNRLYTKKGRLETALRYGFWSDDAFQDQKSLGLSLGYHFNEFFSLHGFYNTISASNSQAFSAAAIAAPAATPYVNPAKSVMGLEGRASLLYGKLSVLGKSILYYDFNIAAGLSQHKTNLGTSTGYFAGFGQQFYVNRNLFVTFDYRLLMHTDGFTKPGTPTRSLTTTWIQVGVGAFLF